MIDVLLDRIIQRIMNPMWRLAVFGGAVTAFLFVGLIVYVGLRLI